MDWQWLMTYDWSSFKGKRLEMTIPNPLIKTEPLYDVLPCSRLSTLTCVSQLPHAFMTLLQLLACSPWISMQVSEQMGVPHIFHQFIDGLSTKFEPSSWGSPHDERKSPDGGWIVFSQWDASHNGTFRACSPHNNYTGGPFPTRSGCHVDVYMKLCTCI